tara:strand:- start:267 stop:500 length:234 start_codon:yes stop_codon:yes gene_type:complete
MNKIGDFEKQMVEAFDKRDEEEKTRNMSKAEKDALYLEERHEAQVHRRFIERHDSTWRKKNKNKKKIAKASRKANRK